MEENFYDVLARRYDILQSDMDCEKWAVYLSDIIKKYLATGNKNPDIIDLGCGTGSVDVPLMKATKANSLVGLDNAEEMLSVAASREGGDEIIWSAQDITDFELPGNVDVFVSLLDTLDHIMDAEVLSGIFKKVSEYLNDGGLFVFDVITKKHLEETFGDNVFFQDYGEFTLLWDNDYDSEEEVNTAYLTFFEEEEDGLYRRYDGELIERFYSEDDLKDMASKAGLTHLGTFGELKMTSPDEDEERIFLVFRKN